MKEVKRIVLVLFLIINIGLISAYNYAGSYNNFGFGGLFQNTLQYIPIAIAFLVIFWVMNFAVNRTKIRNSLLISLILSIFATYGLTRLNIPINNIFYRIGFNEELLMTIGPWIVLGMAMFIVWKWGFGKLLIIFGLIFLALGIFRVASESGAAIFLGSILLVIGLLINKKEMRRRRYKRDIRGMSAKDLESYKKDRRENRDAKLARWNKAGRRIGKSTAWTIDKGWKATRGVGKGVGWTGKTAWQGMRGVGNAAKWTRKEIKKRQRSEKIARIKKEKEFARKVKDNEQIPRIQKEIGPAKEYLALKPGRQSVVRKKQLMKEQQKLIKEQEERKRIQKKANKEARKEALKEKRINRYNSLLKQKIWDYKKYEAHAGKGSEKAIKKMKSIVSEIAELENKIKKYS